MNKMVKMVVGTYIIEKKNKLQNQFAYYVRGGNKTGEELDTKYMKLDICSQEHIEKGQFRSAAMSYQMRERERQRNMCDNRAFSFRKFYCFPVDKCSQINSVIITISSSSLDQKWFRWPFSSKQASYKITLVSPTVNESLSLIESSTRRNDWIDSVNILLWGFSIFGADSFNYSIILCCCQSGLATR